jgi:hypothetical protein
LVAQVWCKICSNIEGKPKLLAPKLNTFLKHVGHCKTTIPSFGIVIGENFYYKNVTHAKNERIYSI